MHNRALVEKLVDGDACDERGVPWYSQMGVDCCGAICDSILVINI
jgi:hypothetical protein